MRTIPSAVTVAGLLAVLSGCVCNQGGHPQDGSMTQDGAWAAAAISSVPANTKLKVKVDTVYLGTTPNGAYAAMVGPNTVNGVDEAEFELRNTAPKVSVTKGSVYETGSQPETEADPVDISTWGTAYAVRVIPASGSTPRRILIVLFDAAINQGLTITRKSDGQFKKLSASHPSATVDQNGVITPYAVADTPAELRIFRDEIGERARAAGVRPALKSAESRVPHTIGR